jgi:hypothetical protein
MNNLATTIYNNILKNHTIINEKHQMEYEIMPVNETNKFSEFTELIQENNYHHLI